MSALPQHVKVAIVGSGFSGLGMAIRMRQEGMTDFVVLERGDDVGGTWRDNTYPGAACDVPSQLYSFSFALNPEWSHSFSRQGEIQAYLRSCADRFSVREHCIFGCTLTGAQWDDTEMVWRVETSLGALTADVLIAATGGLSDPKLPDIPGVESFQGTTMHSAQWDHSVDLAGKRVAVIGTGASAIQLVPQVAKVAGRLDLYQRTPPWVIPRLDRRITRLERRLYQAFPGWQRAVRSGIYWGRELYILGFAGHTGLMKLPRRLAERHLARQVPDDALRAKLTPSYTIGCKRILISNDYYPALARPNVEVVTDGIAEIRAGSVVDRVGVEREVDAIIYATGFMVQERPLAGMLRDGAGRPMSELWGGTQKAYLGSTVAGYPNLFQLLGPNTGLGHTSQVYMIEAQINYVLGALRALQNPGIDVLDVRTEVMERFADLIDEQMQGTVWTQGGCESWYVDATGRNSTLWPRATWRFKQQTAAFDLSSYEVQQRRQVSARAS